jgi:hypothetical protein
LDWLVWFGNSNEIFGLPTSLATGIIRVGNCFWHLVSGLVIELVGWVWRLNESLGMATDFATETIRIGN